MKRVCLFDGQILAGLSAALLSNENHAHLKTGGYRPVNLKKIMATLVVQRALKRNMMLSKGKFNLADIVLKAEDRERTRRASSVVQQASGNSGYGLTGRHQGANTRRLSLMERLSTTGQGGLEGHQQHRAAAEGRAGSIFLPPDADESKWIMRRFLIDLQRNSDINEDENILPRSRRGSALSVVPAVRDGHQHDAQTTASAIMEASNVAVIEENDRARGTALHLLESHRSSGSSEAKTEIGSPAAR